MGGLIDPVICGTFTRARRYPLIVGRVWGRRVSLNASVGAALGLAMAWAARGLWQHGPLASNALVVYAVAAIAVGLFLQRGRLDGRAPLWTVCSVLAWLAADLPAAATRWLEARPVTVEVPVAPAAPSPAAPSPAAPPGARPVRRWTVAPEAA